MGDLDRDAMEDLGVVLPETEPRRLCPIDPVVSGDLAVQDRRYGDSVVAGMAEQEHVVGECRSAPGRVLLHLDEQEGLGLGADGLGLGVFLHGDLAVEDPPGSDVGGDDCAPEVDQPDVAVSGLLRWNLSDMHGGESARLGQSQELIHHEPVVIDELFQRGAVADVSRTRAVGVETGERGGVDGQVGRRSLEPGQPLAGVA